MKAKQVSLPKFNIPPPRKDPIISIALIPPRESQLVYWQGITLTPTATGQMTHWYFISSPVGSECQHLLELMAREELEPTGAVKNSGTLYVQVLQLGYYKSNKDKYLPEGGGISWHCSMGDYPQLKVATSLRTRHPVWGSCPGLTRLQTVAITYKYLNATLEAGGGTSSPGTLLLLTINTTCWRWCFITNFLFFLFTPASLLTWPERMHCCSFRECPAPRPKGLELPTPPK